MNWTLIIIFWWKLPTVLRVFILLLILLAKSFRRLFANFSSHGCNSKDAIYRNEGHKNARSYDHCANTMKHCAILVPTMTAIIHGLIIGFTVRWFDTIARGLIDKIQLNLKCLQFSLLEIWLHANTLDFRIWHISTTKVTAIRVTNLSTLG